MLKAVKKQYLIDFHEIIHNKCNCEMLHETGIPCPAVINHYHVNGLDINELYKMVIQQYQLTNFYEFLSHLKITLNNPPLNKPIIIENNINNEDLFLAKVKWFHKNNEKYHKLIDDLILKAEEEIVIPPFNMIAKRKNKERKRIRSSIEISISANQKTIDKFDKTMINTIKAYLPNGKMGKNELLTFSKNIAETNKNIIPLNQRNVKKIEILKWFEKNWDIISLTIKK